MSASEEPPLHDVPDDLRDADASEPPAESIATPAIADAVDDDNKQTGQHCPDVKPQDISGTWEVDLSASESLEAVLQLNGALWMVRKIFSRMASTQEIKLEAGTLTVKTSNRLLAYELQLPLDAQRRPYSIPRQGACDACALVLADGRLRIEQYSKDRPVKQLQTYHLEGADTLVMIVQADHLADKKRVVVKRVLRRKKT